MFLINEEFKLDESFTSRYDGKQPQWGPLGYVTYKRTYARAVGDRTEEYWETVRRVVEGCYTVQLNHCRNMRLPWSHAKAQESAQEMYDLMWQFKFLPPGRGLWMMGTNYVWERGSAALQNCAMVSTEQIDTDFSEPFCFLMDMSMLGVGVSFDTKGAGKVTFVTPTISDEPLIAADSKEGWCAVIRRVLESYVGLNPYPGQIDYSRIRPAGSVIKTFGGIAPGPEPLIECVQNLTEILNARVGHTITSTDICDLMNIVGKCVVSGGVRRSAQLILGDPEDKEYLSLKDPKLNGEFLKRWRWASNNSVEVVPGRTDYTGLAAQTAKNGEPGYIWVRNARAYGRMADGETWADNLVIGVNPCLPSWASVRTEDGKVRPLSEISVGDKIWSSEGWTTVTAKWCTGVKDVRCYITDRGPFCSTSNHRVMSEGKKVEVGDAKFIDVFHRSSDTEGPDTVKRESFEIQDSYLHSTEEVWDITVDNRSHTFWCQGFDISNCAEQSLEGYELCVGGDTRIQTRDGVHRIKSLVDKRVEVWNGEKWSEVAPRRTGSGRKLFRVHISDGTFLDCTENHRWFVRGKTKRIFREKETSCLQPGDILPKYTISDTVGISEPNAFEYGYFAGDGYIEKACSSPYICHAVGIDNLDALNIKGTRRKPQIKEGYKHPYCRIAMSKVLTDSELCKNLNDKWSGIPNICFSWDNASILEFIAGLVESDGTVTNKGAGQSESYRIYGPEQLCRDLVLLLTRCGIQSSCRHASPGGTVTNYGERKQSLWYTNIPSVDCWKIPTRVKKIGKASTGYQANRAGGECNLPTRRNQKIVKVEELAGLHDTYCFEEPERHMALFENVLTFQCNLVETFPSRHTTFEEYKRTLKFAYLYAKTITLLPTHNERTNAIMLRNRRIGLSQSGIVESFERHGRSEHFRWCDEGYRYVCDLDKTYSRWLCIPESIKKTSVKPSGTVSLLPGVTPGIHYPHAKAYYRTIRIDATSPLIGPLRDANYRIEKSVYGDNTWVVYFPVIHEVFERSKTDVTLWEQVENVAQMQYYWADNQVSATITFKPEEAKDIKRILELYEHRLKGISFLPLLDHGFEQAPYQTAPEEEIRAYRDSLLPIRFHGDTNEVQEKFCDGETCTL